MAEDLFRDPTDPSENQINYEELMDRLLVFVVLGVEAHKTRFSDGDKTPAARCDVHILDGDEIERDVIEDTLIFPSMLYAALRRATGAYVAGRLTQGPATKGNPPWKLAKLTDDEDRKLANEYVANLRGNSPF